MVKRSRFTREQFIRVLKDDKAGATAPELCRKHGISEATLYSWRSKYWGMEVSDASWASEVLRWTASLSPTR